MSEDVDIDDFDVTPPMHESYDVLPSSEELSFKYNLVKVRHPTDELKSLNIPEFVIKKIRFIYDGILTDASLTNIQPIQIREFILHWRLRTSKIKIRFPDIRSPEFDDVMDDLEFHLKTRLNMAKLGWRGDQTFEVHTRTSYDVKQQHEERINEKVSKWKNRFRPSDEEER